VLLAEPGHAQARPFELGLDGAVTVSRIDGIGGLESSTVQSWAFPVQRLRAGYFPADRVQLQLTMAFSVADWGEVSTVRLNVGIGAAYRLTGQGARSGLFASGGLAIDLLSHNGSDAQWAIGGGIGYKVPLGDRLAFRPALEIERSLASTLRPGNTAVSGLVGLSFFTN
jgi:hypothetical protein